jgi:hypothetical protein
MQKPIKEPSLHITKANLIKVLKEVQDNDEFYTNREAYHKLADAILRRGKKYSIYSRTLNITTDKDIKKIKKVTSSELSYTNEFLKSFYAIRRLKHRVGNIKYDENHADWPTIKELGGHLKDFVKAYDLELKNGSTIFVKLLFEVSPKAVINFWPKMVPKAIDLYQSLQEVKKDQYPEQTEKLHKIYNQNLIDKVGISNNYMQIPSVYKFFVEATRLCIEELNCDIETFVKAQFDGLSWSGSYPQPSQMVTEAAKERVVKYAYSNNITLKKKVEKPKIDWKQIKKNR